jgi:hypothetical protein
MIGTAQILGTTWSVWSTAMASWTYLAYVLSPVTSCVNSLDVRAFTEDALSRGLIKPSWYLIDVEAGFEIWQGGQGLAVSSFSVDVGDAGSSGSSGNGD